MTWNKKTTLVALRLTTAAAIGVFLWSYPPPGGVRTVAFVLWWIYLGTSLALLFVPRRHYSRPRFTPAFLAIELLLLGTFFAFYGGASWYFLPFFLLTLLMAALARRLVWAVLLGLTVGLVYLLLSVGGDGGLLSGDGRAVDTGTLILQFVILLITAGVIGYLSEELEHEEASTDFLDNALQVLSLAAGTLDVRAIYVELGRVVAKLFPTGRVAVIEVEQGSETGRVAVSIHQGREISDLPINLSTHPEIRAALDRLEAVVVCGDGREPSPVRDMSPGQLREVTILAIPIVIQAQPRGVVFVNLEDHHLTEQELTFCRLIAGAAAQATERAERSTMTEERFTALHTIDLAIASELDREAVLEIVVEQTVSRLGVDAADVLLWNPDNEQLEFGAGKGFRTAALKHTKLSLGEGYAGRVAAEGGMLNLDLADATEFERSEHLPEEGFTEYYGVALVARGELKGVLEVFTHEPLEPDAEWRDFLELLAGQAAIAIDNAILIADLQRSKEEVIESYDRTLEGWSRALDLRDRDTKGHTQRVTDLTIRLARATGLGEDELVHVRRGALLHDIGKLGVPDSILHKPGPLTDQEWEIMRLHPIHAYEFLSSIPFLLPALDIPYYHHERWDGTGYPGQLKGEEIPFAARIFAVADAWDALTSDRPYQKARPAEEAQARIRESAGSYFDPDVVTAFHELVQQGVVV